MRIFKKGKGQIKELPSEIEELKEDVRQTRMPEIVSKIILRHAN